MDRDRPRRTRRAALYLPRRRGAAQTRVRFGHRRNDAEGNLLADVSPGTHQSLGGGPARAAPPLLALQDARLSGSLRGRAAPARLPGAARARRARAVAERWR